MRYVLFQYYTRRQRNIFQKRLDLTSGNISKKLVVFSIPIFLSLIFQIFYQTIDMIFVGKYVGSAAITAINNVSGVIWVIAAFINGISTGGSILIAQYKGAKNIFKQNETLGTLLTIILFISTIFTIIALIFHRELLMPLNIPQEARAYANEFFSTLSIGWVFTFGFNTACDVMRGLGNSKHPFYAMIISTISNIILAFLFVKIFNLGTKGAAISTVISESVAFGYTLTILKKVHFKNQKMVFFSFNNVVFKELLKIGLPIAIQIMILNFSYLLMATMINYYGLIVATAAGIGFKVSSFMIAPIWAIGKAIAVMVGQNLGAKKVERIKRIVLKGLKINLIVTVLTILIIQIFAKQVVTIFDKDTEVIKNGVIFIRFVCSFGLILYAIMFTFDLFTTGIGCARFALFNSLIGSVIIRIPICLFFSCTFKLGFKGIYLGEAFTSMIPAVIGTLYFVSGKWENE